MRIKMMDSNQTQIKRVFNKYMDRFTDQVLPKQDRFEDHDAPPQQNLLRHLRQSVMFLQTSIEAKQSETVEGKFYKFLDISSKLFKLRTSIDRLP